MIELFKRLRKESQEKPISDGEKYMYSVWDTCIREAESIELTYQEEKEGDVVLAPNGEISAYNNFRPFENGTFLDDVRSPQNPINLLARLVRTETFINGSPELKWVGWGDWISGNNSGIPSLRYPFTDEPKFVFHGARQDIPLREGIQPTSDVPTHRKSAWFSADREYSESRSKGMSGADKGILHAAFLSSKSRDGNVVERVPGEYVHYEVYDPAYYFALGIDVGKWRQGNES